MAGTDHTGILNEADHVFRMKRERAVVFLRFTALPAAGDYLGEDSF